MLIVLQKLMKTSFIILILFITFLFGCMQSKKTANDNNIEIVNAGFENWSELSPVESDVREQGTDLELIVQNWPDGTIPEHIIFRNRKSFPAEITETNENKVTIQARIIRRSAIMSERSESVDISDRLVYTGPDGSSGFVEIEEWEKR